MRRIAKIAKISCSSVTQNLDRGPPACQKGPALPKVNLVQTRVHGTPVCCRRDNYTSTRAGAGEEKAGGLTSAAKLDRASSYPLMMTT